MKNLFTKRIGLSWIALLIFVVPAMMGCDNQNAAVNDDFSDGIYVAKDITTDLTPTLIEPCEGNYTITTAWDLLNVLNCSSITGDLIIQNTSLTNLNALSNLTEIGGNLIISEYFRPPLSFK